MRASTLVFLLLALPTAILACTVIRAGDDAPETIAGCVKVIAAEGESISVATRAISGPVTVILGEDDDDDSDDDDNDNDDDQSTSATTEDQSTSASASATTEDQSTSASSASATTEDQSTSQSTSAAAVTTTTLGFGGIDIATTNGPARRRRRDEARTTVSFPNLSAVSGPVTIRGSAEDSLVSFANLQAAGPLVLESAGDITIAGLETQAGSIRIKADGNIDIPDLRTTVGSLRILGEGSVSFGSLQSVSGGVAVDGDDDADGDDDDSLSVVFGDAESGR
jgi:hypothetical protein